MFSKKLIEEETADWVFENFEWAITSGTLTRSTPLVEPTDNFFTAGSGDTEATARELVQDIKNILGIGDHRIDVISLDNIPVEHRNPIGELSSVAGTFQVDENTSLVRYDAALMPQKLAFIATLTHELMHHILSYRTTELPGGEEAEEPNTDIQSICAGFGLIQIMGAEKIGWLGYLRQPTRAYALALFGRLRETSVDILKYLGPRESKYYRKALKILVKREPEFIRLQNAMKQ